MYLLALECNQIAQQFQAQGGNDQAADFCIPLIEDRLNTEGREITETFNQLHEWSEGRPGAHGQLPSDIHHDQLATVHRGALERHAFWLDILDQNEADQYVRVIARFLRENPIGTFHPPP